MLILGGCGQGNCSASLGGVPSDGRMLIVASSDPGGTVISSGIVPGLSSPNRGMLIRMFSGNAPPLGGTTSRLPLRNSMTTFPSGDWRTVTVVSSPVLQKLVPDPPGPLSLNCVLLPRPIPESRVSGGGVVGAS